MRWKFPAALLASGALAYLTLWPVPADPVAWDIPTPPDRAGVWAANTRMAGLEVLAKGQVQGPEDLAVDAARGVIWSGLHDGRIVRMSPDGARVETVANTGGIPLGVDLAPDGTLVIADADRGLLRLDPDTATLTVLSTEEGGRPYLFTDAPDVGQDGRIWFTDASDRWRQPDYLTDILEHRPNGRLLVYDPATRQTTRVLNELCFANGVALNPAEDAVLVAETGRARVLRVYVAGPRAGQSEVVIENLVGYPDNLTADPEGGYWLGLFAPRKAGLERLLRWPALTRMVMRLPVKPKAAPVGMAVRFDDTGRVLQYLEDPSGRFYPVTNVEPAGDWLYLGSLHADAFARLPRSALDLP